MSEHPNAAIVRDGFDRFVQGDVTGLVELQEGRWTNIRAQPLDQPAFDAFWS